ncbi:unnamed protein product [Urochloa decumbens]|uniref:KIB1-4 beta-propeller domain-containing protein n=1 Tax=Urochloa decumbens TaxID=240449 RepID=A0ABC9AKJ2_9POAL
MKGALSSWSGIPVELAGLVVHHLHAHVDRVRFAAVCKQWRSAAQQVALPPPLPLQALKDGSGTFYSMPRGEPLRFPGCDDDIVTASGNWLVYNRLHCLLLVDPFCGATMTLPSPPIIYCPYNSDDGDEVDYSTIFVLVKLIVCSPHLIAALFQDGSAFWVALSRPGASSWSVARKLPMWIFDIAFYKEKLYAVSGWQDLLALDISVDDNNGDPQVAQVRKVIDGCCITIDVYSLEVLYLIESRGSLLMVRRRIFDGHIHDKGQIHTFDEQSEPELVVFEADVGQARWAKVMTLGDDQALFLGTCSRAVCMPESHSQEKRVWLLDDYKKDGSTINSSYGSNVPIRKFSCPLPKISWKGHIGCAGAVWLFPSN